MADGFAAPPINPLISIQPLTTPQPERDTTLVSKALLSIPNGTTVEGFVVNRNAQSNPVLRTPFGDVLIQSDFFLKTGSVVIFRVDASQTTRARILTVDGLTPSDYVASQTRIPQGDSIANTGVPTSASPLVAANMTSEEAMASGPTLQAILVSKPPVNAVSSNLSNLTNPESITASGFSKIQIGAQLRITVLKAELPAPLMQPTGNSSVPQHMNQAAYASTLQPDINELLLNATPPTSAASSAANPSRNPVTSRAMADVTAPSAGNPSPSTRTASGVTRETIAPPSTAPLTFQPILSRAQTPSATPETPATFASAAASHSATEIPTAAPRADAPAIRGESTARTANNPSSLAPPSPQAPRTAATTSGVPSATGYAAYKHVAAAPSYIPASNASRPVANPAASHVVAGSSTLTTQPATMPATIIGQEADGATILHTPIGAIKTYLPQPLPAGTSLEIAVKPELSSAASPTSLPVDAETSTTTSLMREWDTLKEMVIWANQSEPLIHKVLLNALPQVDAKLTSGLLFFIAAMKGGDVQQWLGKNLTRALEVKAADFLKRLKSDALNLQQMLTETTGQQWSSASMPLAFQGELHHARLFYRQDNESEQEDSNEAPAHRFIVEVELSHLGDLQFDGFVRSGTKKRVFDLVIRSAKLLNESIKNEIRTRFDDALKTTGYQGYLTFQVGSQNFVRPLAQLKANLEESNTILA